MQNLRKPNRFSVIIDIKKLERESYRYLYIGFLIAVVFHALLALFWKFEITVTKIREVELKSRKPIPVDIIVLPPRILNPYETWRRIIKKRMYAGRRFKTIQPDVKHVEHFTQEDYERFKSELWKKFINRRDNLAQDYHVDFDTLAEAVLDSLIYSDLPDSIKALIDPELFVIERIYEDLTISKEPKDIFSLEDEMLTLEDIDELGAYKGFVIMDPADKQNIKGFVHIPKYIWEDEPPPVRKVWVKYYKLPAAVNGLAEVVNLYTGIDIKVDRQLDLKYDDLFSYPVLYVTIDLTFAFEISSQRTKNFGEYLRNGGFAIIENGRPWKKNSPAKLTLLNIVREALGEDFKLQPIPYGHPVYNCFFDIEDLPIEGAENWTPPLEREDKIPDWRELLHNPEVNLLSKKMQNSAYDLLGIWIDERLVAIYSDKGYGHFWHKGLMNSDFSTGNGTKNNFNQQLKLGVNMVMFALTQKDGIAKKVVDYNAHRRKGERP